MTWKTKTFYMIEMINHAENKSSLLKIKREQQSIRCFMRLLNNPNREGISLILNRWCVNLKQNRYDKELVIRVDSDDYEWEDKE